MTKGVIVSVGLIRTPSSEYLL